MRAPCGDCDKKGCGAYHDQCEKYQAFKQALDEERKAREVTRKLEPLNPYMLRNINEKSKRKRWKRK